MPPATGFQVFCSNHPELLLAVAARRLAAAVARLPPDDLRGLPVLVPSAPARDRLRDALASELGACAGLDLLLPGEFTGAWLPRRLGLDAREFAAISAESARWRICAALDAAPGIAPDQPTWDARRLALAKRVTDALLRLANWDGDHSAVPWAAGEASPYDVAYPFLKPLWDAVVQGADPKAAQRALVAALADAQDLPPLVLAVATPDLSPQVLEVLAALGRQTLVQVVIQQPVPGDWSDQTLAWKAGGPAEEAWSHRLLAQWGIEHRQALRRLDAAGAEISSEDGMFVIPEGDTLLARMQRDLATGTARPSQAEVKQEGTTPDDSLVAVCAFGPRAEAEAVKHRLTAWFCAGDLAPHEVCIACPDPAVYAPLLRAVFAGLGEGPAIPLDLKAADGAPDPATAVALALAGLMPGRWAAPTVFSLLAAGPVAEPWGFTGRFLDRLRTWCDTVDLRFATDGEHRQALGLPGDPAATWRRGLQRLAWSAYLGADTDEVAIHAGTVPVAGQDEAEAAAAARLAEVLLPLLDAAPRWRTPHPPAWWAEELPRLVRHLRRHQADDGDADDAALSRRLHVWAQHLEEAGFSQAPVAADLVAALLEEGPGPAPVRAGGIAVGTPASLRGHAWDVVCLMGFDHQAFPRQPSGGDVDPLVRTPVPGQPDPRHQDRAALLDLVTATRRHLLVSWTGRDPRTGEPLPPCPAIADLLEIAATTAGLADGSKLVQVVALDPARVLPPGLPWPSPQRQAQAAARHRAPLPATPLVPAVPQAGNVPAPTFDDLRRFLADPPLAYLRHLGIRLGEAADGVADHERLVLDDALENWQLRDELLAHLLPPAAKLPGVLVDRWAARGAIPGGSWGRIAVARQVEEITDLLDQHGALMAECRRTPVILDVDLGHGQRVTGAWDHWHPELGPVVIHAGKAGAKHRQRAWLLGLLGQAAGQPGGGLLITTDKRIELPSTSAAGKYLGQLVELYRLGLGTPLPLVPAVLDAWATASDPIAALISVGNAWSRTPGVPGMKAPAEQPAAARIWPDGADPWTMTADDLAAWATTLGATVWTDAALKARGQAMKKPAKPGKKS